LGHCRTNKASDNLEMDAEIRPPTVPGWEDLRSEIEASEDTA